MRNRGGDRERLDLWAYIDFLKSSSFKFKGSQNFKSSLKLFSNVYLMYAMFDS